jgi:hypothetical protein
VEDALRNIIDTLSPLAPDDRGRVLRAVATFFEVESSARYASVSIAPRTPSQVSGSHSSIGYSENLDTSPKEFLMQKQPRTDVERVACLAYYLSHYRNTPYFKTLDLSKLNTEAAQRKFANPTWASNNALKLGYLATATKGNRQLSAAGEQFVSALPDRDAARKAMDSNRPHRRGRKKTANDRVKQ